MRYKRLRKGLKDASKISADNQHHLTSSSTDGKNAERSYASRVSEHKESSSTSRGAGIACNAMYLDPGSKQQQPQQRVTRGGSTLQQRLAELSQSLSSSVDTQSAAAVNTDLAALLSAISAAVNRPTHS